MPPVLVSSRSHQKAQKTLMSEKQSIKPVDKTSGDSKSAGAAEVKSGTVTSAFVSNRPALSRYVGRLLGSRYSASDVEDFTQETFIRAFSAKQAEDLEFPKAYLFRIARNLVVKSGIRKTNPLKLLVEDFEIEGIIDSIPKQDEALHQKKRLEAFYDAANRLPRQCRRALLLRQIEGLSHKQISKRMGISTSTVEKHLAKGLRLCVEFMNEAGYEPGDIVSVDKPRQNEEKN